MDEQRAAVVRWEDGGGGGVGQPAPGRELGGVEPRDQLPPSNVLTIAPGMTMAAIERAAIEAALRETRGNRRRAAEMLGIGERTLYRKLREYELPEDLVTTE
jgi:DNA-binding NtrC family response regulator